MKVDPSGLADAARRITAALAQLPSADPVHPALAGDVASQGAAARLTSGAATLAALIGGSAPPPAHAPDVRPPLPPPVPAAGEAISRATHSGDPGGGDAFISGWAAVAAAGAGAAR